MSIGAPTQAVATAETRQAIRGWLAINAKMYARQANKPGEDWHVASIACRDVMLGAIAALEQAWSEEDRAFGKM